MSPGHQPVLLREVLGLLSPVAGGRYLDCTFGGGGHTAAILESAQGVQVVALDRDPEAIVRAEPLLARYPGRFEIHSQNFSNLKAVAGAGFDGILFDLGLSSFQLDDAARGFSFRSDAPADMRMDPRSGVPASLWLETATAEMIESAVRDLGEEPSWRRVSRAIIAARGTGKLGRTASLAEVIASAIPTPLRRTMRIHPATRSFQGIRIAVNDELGALQGALREAFAALRPGGVMCVISFHSLEDRPVKRFFRGLCGQPETADDSTPQDLRTRTAEPLTGRPIVPTSAEVEDNPRSRSAKLRAVKKL